MGTRRTLAVHRATGGSPLAASPHRHFIVSQQLTPALINALINGGIAWAMHKDKAALALWGAGGYWSDLLATGILLPGLTWMILHPLTRWQARQGKAPATGGVPRPLLASRLPSGLWTGAAATGGLGGAIGLLAIGLMQVLGAPSMGGGTYAVFKGIYGGLFPVLLQPAMVFAILRPAAAGAAAPAPAPG